RAPARDHRGSVENLLRQRDHDAHDRPRGAAPHLGHAVRPLRDVVRPGVEQGAPLTTVLSEDARAWSRSVSARPDAVFLSFEKLSEAELSAADREAAP